MNKALKVEPKLLGDVFFFSNIIAQQLVPTHVQGCVFFYSNYIVLKTTSATQPLGKTSAL